MTYKSYICVLDMQGGKPGSHFSREEVSPTVTRGRASVNDIHIFVQVEHETK